MTRIHLPALLGDNPLGFLAAVGVLYSATEQCRPSAAVPRLGWTDDLEPSAFLELDGTMDDLLDVLEVERDAVCACMALNWPPGEPLSNAKLLPARLREWAAACYADEDPRSARIFNALVAEGAIAPKGDAKPTHLDFAAGPQQFLETVRRLGSAATRDELHSALVDWRPTTAGVPSLAWDTRDERTYALRATDPGNDSKPVVVGANWLAFLGLGELPVVALPSGAPDGGWSLVTTGCERPWKSSTFSWPLWSTPISLRTTAALVRGGVALVAGATERTAQIRRTDQGGYGNFGAAVSSASSSVPNPLLRA